MVDITTRIFEAAAELGEPNMIHLPNFSLEDSMSAIELMDRKLDTGLTLSEIDPIAAMYESGTIQRVADMKEEDVIGMIDNILRLFAMWIQGQSVAQTLYTWVYLYDDPVDPLIQALTNAQVYIVHLMHEAMMRNASVREDDYSYVPLNFDEFLVTEEEVNERLIAQEHALPYAATRIKFMRALVSCVSHLNKPKCAGYNRVPEQQTFALKQLAEMEEGFGKNEVPPVFHDTMFLLKVIAFPPKKISYEYTYEHAITLYKRFFDSVTKILALNVQFPCFETLIERLKEFTFENNLTRILVEVNLFEMRENDLLYVYSQASLKSLMSATFEKTGFDVGSVSQHPDFVEFLNRVCFVHKELAHLPLKNRSRQRRIMGKLLSDLSILVNEADWVETNLVGGKKGGGRRGKKTSPVSMLLNWFFDELLSYMIEYLLLGFELELYHPQEFTMIHYNLDCLYGMLGNNKENYYKAVAKKKKKLAKELEQQILYTNCNQYLARALFRMELWLTKNGAIPTPGNDAVRYRHRFQAFDAVSISRGLDYETFSNACGKISEDPDLVETTKHVFDTVGKNFANQGEYEDSAKLRRVAVANGLALTMCEKLGFKGGFSFTEHAIFPTWKL